VVIPTDGSGKPKVYPVFATTGDGPAQWGRAIHKDAKGRPDIFIRYLGGDYRMITHVLWAMEAKGTEAG